MTKLSDLTLLIRSKNAGPFELTFDVLFREDASYRRIRDSQLLSADLIGRMYNVAPDRVAVIPYDAASAIKITIPRPVSAGDLEDGDIFGGQQYGPLVELEVPE